MRFFTIFLIATALLTSGTAFSNENTDQPNLSFILDHSNIASGGLENRSVTRWLLEAGITWDLEQAAGIPGAELFAGVQIQRGANGSDFAGDIQGFSNIDADNFDQLGEVGFAQTLKDGRLRYKLGRLDANSDFAVVEAGGDFINSSAGYTPPIHTFPSYPNPVLAANLFFQPDAWYSIGTGVYESILEDEPGNATAGLFTIAEAQFFWNEDGRLAFGFWRDHGALAGFDGTVHHSHNGLYIILEQGLGDNLDLFLQVGSADDAVAEITANYAAGLAATGLLPNRHEDTTGFMISRAVLSDLIDTGFREDETALELFYRYRICNRFILKPDLQYIIHPSGDPLVDDAFVVTLRMEFGF